MAITNRFNLILKLKNTVCTFGEALASVSGLKYHSRNTAKPSILYNTRIMTYMSWDVRL